MSKYSSLGYFSPSFHSSSWYSQLPLPAALEAGILIVIQHHKGVQWLILSTLLSALLVRSLRFDISMPVNKSSAAKPGVEVY